MGSRGHRFLLPQAAPPASAPPLVFGKFTSRLPHLGLAHLFGPLDAITFVQCLSAERVVWRRYARTKRWDDLDQMIIPPLPLPLIAALLAERSVGVASVAEGKINRGLASLQRVRQGSLMRHRVQDDPEASAPPLVHVFFCYSSEDGQYEALLETQVAVLERIGAINSWGENRLAAGEDRRRAVERYIGNANLAVLLLSPDFLACPAVQEVQLPLLLARHERGDLAILTVLIRPCLWQVHPQLRRFTPLPRSGVPIASLDRAGQDRAFSDVTRVIAVETERRFGEIRLAGLRSIPGGSHHPVWPWIAGVAALVVALGAITWELWQRGRLTNAPYAQSNEQAARVAPADLLPMTPVTDVPSGGRAPVIIQHQGAGDQNVHLGSGNIYTGTGSSR